MSGWEYEAKQGTAQLFLVRNADWFQYLIRYAAPRMGHLRPPQEHHRKFC